MERTTIFVEESLRREIKALARRQSRSAAAVVREAILRLLEAENARSRPDPSFLAIGASGQGDVAERHEELLFRRLQAHPPARGRQRKKVAPR